MQVKPRFDTYKILESKDLFKDDLNNLISLCLFEVKAPSDDIELVVSPYKFWTVCSKQQEQWGNKSVSYSNIAFWKTKKKELFKQQFDNFLVEELEDGLHNMFVTSKTESIPLPEESQEEFKKRWEKIKENQGLRTKFKISLI